MTRDEFTALAKKWNALMYWDSAGELTGERYERLQQQLGGVEKQMDEAPWQFDDDGNVVPRDSVTQPYVNPQCLNDNAPCAPNGEGNCVACDRVFGDSVTSNSVTQ